MLANSAKLGILAGGGVLPRLIAREAVTNGRSVHILAIDGSFGDWPGAPCAITSVGLGSVGQMIATLRKEGCTELCIAGAVERPDLKRVHFDLGGLLNLPRIVGMMLGGDNHLLTTVVRFFEGKGFKVVGAHEVAPSLLAAVGALGRVHPTSEAKTDMAHGFEVARMLGTVDVGQAAVVSRGYVLAVEAAEGTDAMIERVRELRAKRGRLKGRRVGVLVKRAKPSQDRRVDLPVIGLRTVDLVAGANLAGIGVHVGGVMLLEPEKVLAAADAAGIFIVGYDDGK